MDNFQAFLNMPIFSDLVVIFCITVNFISVHWMEKMSKYQAIERKAWQQTRNKMHDNYMSLLDQYLHLKETACDQEREILALKKEIARLKIKPV